ncbi:MAG: primosomal replication protein N [Rhodoferax sp.]
MPSLRFSVASPQPTTAGMPSSRAMMAARQVKLAMKSVAFASVAERLASQGSGKLSGTWRFKGFLASQRNGKGVVFHIQEFAPD